MAKRRERRRQRRRERKERSPEEREAAQQAQPPAAVKPEAEGDRTVEGVSWTGVAGAVMGFLPMAALTVAILIDPGGESRAWALLFAFPALGFLPALWASVRPVESRQRIQRATVIGCLLLVFASAFLLGLFLIPFVLMPATALLAVAAGLIFQGGGRK